MTTPTGRFSSCPTSPRTTAASGRSESPASALPPASTSPSSDSIRRPPKSSSTWSPARRCPTAARCACSAARRQPSPTAPTGSRSSIGSASSAARAVLLESLTVVQNLAMPFTLEIEPPVGRHSPACRGAGADESGWPTRRSTVRWPSLGRPALVRVRLGRALALDPASSSSSIRRPRCRADAVARTGRAVPERLPSATIALTADPDFAEAVAERCLTLDPATGTAGQRAGWFSRLAAGMMLRESADADQNVLQKESAMRVTGYLAVVRRRSLRPVRRRRTGAKPRVFFVEPKNGATVKSPVHLKFGVENYKIAAVPDGDVKTARPGVGHFHVGVDTPCVDAGKTIVKGTPSWVHFGKGDSEIDMQLTPGKHKLAAAVRRRPAQRREGAVLDDYGERRAVSGWNGYCKTPAGPYAGPREIGDAERNNQATRS